MYFICTYYILRTCTRHVRTYWSCGMSVKRANAKEVKRSLLRHEDSFRLPRSAQTKGLVIAGECILVISYSLDEIRTPRRSRQPSPWKITTSRLCHPTKK